MIPNCQGCEQELEEALFLQDKYSLHVVTSPDLPNTYPQGRHHVFIIMVNDNGDVVLR
jgi:hypothetical protein